MSARLPLLLLPGMHGTGALYGAFAEQLAPGILPLVVEYPPVLGPSYEHLADMVEVPDGPFGIVAESFSGPVGVLLAARYPERVRGLVLAATFVRAPAMARLAALLPARFFDAPPPDFALRAALLGDDADAASVTRLREVLSSVPPRVIADRLRLVATVDVSATLASISAAVLQLEPTRDRLLTGASGRAIRAARPTSTHHALDAPHLVLQHAPETTARLVSAHFGA